MKRQALIFYCLLTLISASGIIQAQIPTQVIRGRVTDKDTREPLIGANVTIVNSNPELGGVTDLDGKFEITAVPVGRVQIECTYIGYGSFLSDPFILNS